MLCASCNRRKAKRACPALGRQICTVCCGTKRLVEIRCPSDCGYLSSSRSHPPAVVQRQQEIDRTMFLPLLQGLSERQARLFLMFGAGVVRHQSDLLQKLVDDDIAQAAGALAATLETASRGIVYDHRPASLPAERLMSELKALFAEVAKNAGTAIERDAGIALRRIEQAAKTMSGAGSGNDLQQLLGRVLIPTAGADGQEQGSAAQAPPPSLLIP